MNNLNDLFFRKGTDVLIQIRKYYPNDCNYSIIAGDLRLTYAHVYKSIMPLLISSGLIYSRKVGRDNRIGLSDKGLKFVNHLIECKKIIGRN